ncbi:MAG TPA: sialidase family protein, partial [Actinomycetota bacterium]|nr:sialidase family protein [Actinomycetota bacterium]
GSLVYTWTGRDHLPYVARSTDGGKTWSPPMMIAPPKINEAALPRVAAGPNGVIAVAYIGTENAPGGPPYYDFCNVHLGDCTDGRYAGVRWDGYIALIRHPDNQDAVIRTTTAGRPSAPLLVGGCSAEGGCKAVLDFVDVQFDATGAPWAAFVDDCAIKRDFEPVFSRDLPRCGDGVGEGIVLTIARVGRQGIEP